jgi:Sec-independent protein secretion pathway component TatC
MIMIQKILKVNTMRSEILYFVLFVFAITTTPPLPFNLHALAYGSNIGNNINLLNNENLADLFEIASGIFAAVLCALSLIAYRNLKSKRMLLVSGAFGIFAIHAIVSSIDVFIPGIEFSSLELITSILIFISLTFFFLAIVKRFKINERKPTSPQSF